MGELEALPGGDLDVDRHPAQVPEGHPEERGLAGAQQELLGGVGQEAIGRLRRARALTGGAQAVIAGPQGLRPRGELGHPPVGAVAVERGHLQLALEPLEQVGIGQEQERPEGLLGDGRTVRAARVDRDVGFRRTEREKTGSGIVPEEEGIGVERERDRGQLSRPRRRCSSRRAVT